MTYATLSIAALTTNPSRREKYSAKSVPPPAKLIRSGVCVMIIGAPMEDARDRFGLADTPLESPDLADSPELPIRRSGPRAGEARLFPDHRGLGRECSS